MLQAFCQYAIATGAIELAGGIREGLHHIIEIIRPLQYAFPARFYVSNKQKQPCATNSLLSIIIISLFDHASYILSHVIDARTSMTWLNLTPPNTNCICLADFYKSTIKIFLWLSKPGRRLTHPKKLLKCYSFRAFNNKSNNNF